MKALVIKDFKRPDRKWIDKFKKIPTSIISDCLNRHYAMAGDMMPIFKSIRIVGTAITIKSMAGNNMMSHLALTFAKQDDVLVIDAGGYLNTAVWGGIQARYAQKVGVGGLILDGSIRDVEEMRSMRFPVYCKGVTPAGPHKGWADSVNVPIQCGGVPVRPGDLVVGDDDGVAVVPQERIEKTYEEALMRLEKEESWLKKIENGCSSLEAVGLEAALKNMDIEYRDE